MKRLAVGVTLAALALAAPSARTFVSKTNRNLDKFLNAKDKEGFVSAMKSVTTDDYKFVESGKDGTRELSLQEMADLIFGGTAELKNLKAHSVLRKFSSKGDTSTAVMLRESSWDMAGEDKQIHRFTSTALTTDTWIRTAGGWKLSKMQFMDTGTLVDGKKMKSPAVG